MEKLIDAIGGNIITIAAIMVPIAIVAITSYFGHKRTEMIHRERLAAIEKGLPLTGELPDPEKHEPEPPKTPPNFLHRGLFWLCPGAGAVVFSLVYLGDTLPAIRLPILGVSLVTAGVGAAYIVIHMVESERARTGVQ
jgi:hypothetical protein